MKFCNKANKESYEINEAGQAAKALSCKCKQKVCAYTCKYCGKRHLSTAGHNLKSAMKGLSA